MKNINLYSSILELLAYFISAVILTALAMKYEPQLALLPCLFFGLYTSKLVVKRIKKGK
ncbi:hypothetical protein [Flavobacterium psychrotrophum]|uniref:hypothetical protein n=1 Tax=Flavobacterium psychrotrophum TaxID=2294119 RepID=UPI0013C48F05|nr:hypothetical protein [Flavobacterium psychrotrophum]